MANILDELGSKPKSQPVHKPERTQLICSDYPWGLHTKRPYRVVSSKNMLVAKISIGALDKIGAMDGNVALISAAPELYSALAEIVDACWEHIPEESRRRAATALSKATDLTKYGS